MGSVTIRHHELRYFRPVRPPDLCNHDRSCVAQYSSSPNQNPCLGTLDVDLHEARWRIAILVNKRVQRQGRDWDALRVLWRSAVSYVADTRKGKGRERHLSGLVRDGDRRYAHVRDPVSNQVGAQGVQVAGVWLECEHAAVGPHELGEYEGEIAHVGAQVIGCHSSPNMPAHDPENVALVGSE